MVEIRDVLGLLDGVKQHGSNQWMARCPCHNDKRQSLAVSMGEKGIVMHCMAGCETSAIVEALGLTFADIMKDGRREEEKPALRVRKANPNANKPTETPAEEKPAAKRPADLNALRVGGIYATRGRDGITQHKIVRCYEYEDAAGAPILRVYRTEDKEFPVVHKDGDGWFWGDGGHGALLYRLPQVIAAVREGRRILIAEGEKDVETLEGLGFCATTNKGGASKWPKEAGDALRGAKVAILPDLDEAGSKHAAAIATSLASVAREVRMVNLRRLGVELPEKGDISDAAERMGANACATALTELIDRSPVISRVVSDEDYEEYFQFIRGASVRNGCICALRGDEWKPLCNFVALPTEQVMLDDGLSDPRYSLTVAGWSNTGDRLPPLTVPLDEFDRMDWPLRGWGLRAVISEDNGAKQKLRRIVQEAGSRSAVMRTRYCHTGWREIDGRLCYLHGGGAIGADGVEVKLDFGFSRYNLDGWEDEEIRELDRADGRRSACKVSLRAMGVAGMRIGAPLTGLMYLAPLRYFLEQQGHRPSMVPFVRGKSGTGKSTIAALILSHFGRHFGFESSHPASFEDTAAGLSLKLFTLKDCVLMIDDFHPETDPKRAAQMSGTAEAVSRMIGDGVARSRMRSDTTAQIDRPARALCLETGEQVPNVANSSVARFYVIDVQPGDVPLPGQGAPEKQEEMKNLHILARQGALAEAMRGYVEWLGGQSATLAMDVDATLSRLQDEAIRRCAGAGLHARMPQAMAYLMLGLEYMLRYMSREDGILSLTDKEQIMLEAWEAVIANTREQGLEMVADKPTEVFTQTLRELISSGRVAVQDTSNPSAALPKDMIGYRDDEYYYLSPGPAYAAVQKCLNEQGSRMILGKNQILRDLATEKLLVPDANGRNTRVYNRGGLRFRSVWIPRDVVDGAKPMVQVELPKGIFDDEGGDEA